MSRTKKQRNADAMGKLMKKQERGRITRILKSFIIPENELAPLVPVTENKTQHRLYQMKARDKKSQGSSSVQKLGDDHAQHDDRISLQPSQRSRSPSRLGQNSVARLHHDQSTVNSNTDENSVGDDDAEDGDKKGADKKTAYIDPIFQFESLRDAKMIDYYCHKMAVQRNQISPACKESEKERARRDPYNVLSKSQKVRMHEIRQSNRLMLHNLAIKELEQRKVRAQERKAERIKLEREQEAAASLIYLEQFTSDGLEDHSIDSIDSLDINR